MLKILSLLLFALPSFGSAAESVGNMKSVYFFGEITPETVDAFISKYDANNELRELRINSQGGDVKAGIKFGRWVQKKGLNVTVPKLCFSACANYVFIAGKNKVLEPGAFVAWHGDAEQKDFRELIDKYENLSLNKKRRILSDDEKEFLLSNEKRYQSLRVIRKMQAEYYTLLNVNGEFGRAGQEPVNYPSDGWTLTKKAMEHFGILNVEVPKGYGTVEYFLSAPLAAIINKGPLLILDIDSNGKIFPVNLSEVSNGK